MTKLNLWLTIAAIFGLSVSPAFGQICNPDTTVTELGLFPDTLATATLGTQYAATLNAGLPKDTLILGIPLAFCTYKIDSVKPNLGDLGLAFDCDQPDCTYDVDQSMDLNFGCVVVSGTPTALFDDSLTVFVSAEVGNFDANTNTCTPTGTLGPLEFKVPFKIVQSVNVEESVFGTVKLFPNPTASNSLLAFELETSEDLDISLFDMTGRLLTNVWTGVRPAGAQSIEIPTADLSAGVYLIQIKSAGNSKTYTSKVMVQK
ncbi:MAG: T9SS type A sorting domain-containing protein [Bacteroidota bacterium]